MVDRDERVGRLVDYFQREGWDTETYVNLPGLGKVDLRAVKDDNSKLINVFSYFENEHVHLGSWLRLKKWCRENTKEQCAVYVENEKGEFYQIYSTIQSSSE